MLHITSRLCSLTEILVTSPQLAPVSCNAMATSRVLANLATPHNGTAPPMISSITLVLGVSKTNAYDNSLTDGTEKQKT